MASEESTAASEALAAALAGPAKVSGDAGSVESHKLADMIAADQYVAAKDAALSKRQGLRITRLNPPGAV